MDSSRLMRVLSDDGWTLVHIRGSHHKFKYRWKSGSVTVAHANKDVPIGTARAISKRAGIPARLYAS